MAVRQLGRFALGLVIALAAVAARAAPPAGPGPWQAAAARSHLSRSAEWHALLHYRRNRFGPGVHSEVASPWFFLAADGRLDPAAELRATLAVLWSRRPIGPRRLPAYCLFVARRKFLVRRLHMNTARLPVRHCPRYRRWRAAIDPGAASLVFASAFPDNPASMFGHTLLRIDPARRRSPTDLLSYAVSFAADAPPGHHGAGFVWRGLTGGYAGRFSVSLYYEKVKQYAGIENRDIWSYPLKLRPAALSRLVAHVWEMRRVRFVYYFLNRNCAYELLALLDVARPGLHLTRDYRIDAIPSDIIRRLAAVPGLLGPARYRAARTTRLHWETRHLNPAEKRLAQRLAAGRLTPGARALGALPPAARTAVLEVAYDGLMYRREGAGQAGAGSGAASARAERILAARARIHRRSPFAPVPPPAVSPAGGEGSVAVRLSTVVAHGRAGLGLRLRPAYHDLLDDPGGYTHGAAIDVADLGLRFDPARGRLAMADFRLFSITSLAPRGPWYQPLSFTLATGARRRPVADPFGGGRSDLGYYLEGGPGLAWGGHRLTGYVFAKASLDANPGLRSAYALGLGPSGGLLFYPWPGIQFRLDAGWLQYAAGAPGHYGWLRLGGQCPLIGALALRADVGYEDTRLNRGPRVALGLQAYF